MDNEDDKSLDEELIEAEEALEETQQEEPEESSEENESDEVTERAKKYGHLSKEEWVAAGRDPNLWKSPEEFDKTGKVIEQLYSLKKKVDQRDREIQALIEYQQRTAQREYERAKQNLEAQLAAAEDDMDVKGVSHYTRELTRLEDQEKQSNAQLQQQQQIQAKESFLERNSHWFNERNPDLQQRAVEIDNEILDDINKGRLKVNSYDDIGVMIEKRMQYEHPDRILSRQKVSRPNVSPAMSAVNKTAVVKKDVFRNLSQEHKDTYNVYKRINPNTTEEEFINRLKADGEI